MTEHSASTPETGYASVNGLQMYYEIHGSGGTPLLLLHGITDTWRSFEPVFPFLPEGWHIVSLTQRGHGGSDPATSFRTRDFARR